ncbi:hypothetical protein EU803_02970 [Loktanella sp. IMCC34160]|uniref:hypothetical protein n=1 Tax=Loktanella sp. IMCC34160 TaxID=2510646 RepID=UPI00101D08C7|nr:hypothetical protein [Loktanella sp. IMCC34160]RYG93082.1 hypothetical protein EU803_02970 [Loktanella sp. IMCC34160]
MPGTLSTLKQGGEPVRRAIRRARWFLSTFRDFVTEAEAGTGARFALDDQKLMAAFSAWYRAFEAQRDSARDHRFDYVTFASGLMLRELVRHAPLTLRSAPEAQQSEAPSEFWPEGFVYVRFCLAVRDAVLEQDFQLHEDTAPEMGDLRTWWSFRENVQDDVDSAIAFLELFAGETPNWTMPSVFKPHRDDPRLAAAARPMEVDKKPG